MQIKIEELLKVDCNNLGEVLPTADDIVLLNHMITEPESLIEDSAELDMEDVKLVELWDMKKSDIPEIEIARDEDYHKVRNRGELEVLVEQVMPRECRQNSNGLWLSSVLIGRLAKNQVFGDGNKRTAYLAGVLFLREIQKRNGFNRFVVPKLDDRLAKLLSDVAIHEGTVVDGEKLGEDLDLDRDVEDLYKHFEKGFVDFMTR